MANKDYWDTPEDTISLVGSEMRNGLELLNKIQQPIVSFFGSARMKENDPMYIHCEQTAFELGQKGYAIVTGGGPGIMRAANAGAARANAPSIGIRAALIEGEPADEKVLTDRLEFEFVFLRRFTMYMKSKAWVFYPGGIGTLDELSECLLLRYTGIRNQKPIICVNTAYWQGLFTWLRENAFKNDFLLHGEADLHLVQFADTTEDIIRLIEST